VFKPPRSLMDAVFCSVGQDSRSPSGRRGGARGHVVGRRFAAPVATGVQSLSSIRRGFKTLDSVSVRNIVATLPYSSTARNDGPGIFRPHGIAARCARPIKDSGLRIQSGVATGAFAVYSSPRRHGRSPPRKRQPHPHRHAHGLPTRHARSPRLKHCGGDVLSGRTPPLR